MYIKATKGIYSFSISLVIIKVELVKTLNVNIYVKIGSNLFYSTYL